MGVPWLGGGWVVWNRGGGGRERKGGWERAGWRGGGVSVAASLFLC